MAVLFRRPEGIDNVTETAETLVDVLGLLESRALGLAMIETLGPSEIDEVECALAPLARDTVHTNELEYKDGVRTTGTHVGLRSSDRPVLIGALQNLFHTVGAIQNYRRRIS